MAGDKRPNDVDGAFIMRVVVVLTQPPLPEGGAQGKCAIGLIRGLCAHGVDVQGIALKGHGSPLGEVPKDLPVEVVDITAEASRPRSSPLAGLRRPRGALARGEFQMRIREATRDADVLHLEETETAWCDLGAYAPSLVHMHYRVRRDRGWTEPWLASGLDEGTYSLRDRFDGFTTMLQYALAERVAMRRHRYLAASSPVVADEIRRATPRADVVLSPLSLDPAYYPIAPLDGPPTAGIIGTLAWRPTAEAVRRLLRHVWPKVAERMPEARLQIAGRGMASIARSLDFPGVQVLGEVASASAFLRGLSVLLYPLERGSGMKVKVLESLATGVPVVTTVPGAEGIEGGNGVVIERDDARLAAATIEILTDPDQRRERGLAARQAFERLYTPEAATAPLIDLYARMAASK